MSWLKRQRLAEAYNWKHQREAELLTEIRINMSMLHVLRTQLAQLRKLEGKELVIHFGWLSPDEVERTMRPQQEFVEAITELFVEGMYQGTSEQLFVSKAAGAA